LCLSTIDKGLCIQCPLPRPSRLPSASKGMQSVLCVLLKGDSQTLRDNAESNVHFDSENKLLQENIFSYIKAQAVVRHLQFVQSPYFSTVPHGRLLKFTTPCVI